MGKKEFTRKDIEQALIELDAESEKAIGRTGLTRKGISEYWVRKLIPEGLTELKQQLGLKISSQERPLSDTELFEKIDDIVSKFGIPSMTQLVRETKITEKVFIQRFGKKGKLGVFSHYRKWLEMHKPKSKNIELVDGYLECQGKPKTQQAQLVKREKGSTKIKWPKLSGREVGANLNFGNLIYEPTTEKCVIFLFGMVSKALGFSIEYIGEGFPDCEAKRYIAGRHDRQQHVRIEFEYMSRDYDHPLENCDIIVCWKNNWEECPLEVIELSSEIEKLRKSSKFSDR